MHYGPDADFDASDYYRGTSIPRLTLSASTSDGLDHPCLRWTTSASASTTSVDTTLSSRTHHIFDLGGYYDAGHEMYYFGFLHDDP